jgi:hypothetical protein
MATLRLVGVPDLLIERLATRPTTDNRCSRDEGVAALEQWLEKADLLSKLRSLPEEPSVPPLTDLELRRARRGGRSQRPIPPPPALIRAAVSHHRRHLAACPSSSPHISAEGI